MADTNPLQMGTSLDLNAGTDAQQKRSFILYSIRHSAGSGNANDLMARIQQASNAWDLIFELSKAGPHRKGG